MVGKLTGKGFLEGAAVVAMIISLAGLAQAQRLERVRVSLPPIASSVGYFTALEKGYFEAEGIKAEPQEVAIPTVFPGMAAGSLEMGHQPYFPLFVAREQGFDFTIIAGTVHENTVPKPGTPFGYESPNALVVLEESGIRSMRDLKGKTIAVTAFKGDIHWLAIAEVLSRHGLDPLADVSWIEIPFPRMGPMLRAKQAHAVWLVEPFHTFERDTGGIRVVSYAYSEVSINPALELAGLTASQAWIDKNPQVAERFVRAFRKGLDYMMNNPGDRTTLIAKYTKLKPEIVTKMYLPGYSAYVDVKGLQLVYDLALKWGLAKKKEDVRKFLHPTAIK